MKWKCLSCGGWVPVIPGNLNTICPHCGSDESGLNRSGQPVPLVLITGELPLALEQVPFSAGQVVRLERRRMPEMERILRQVFMAGVGGYGW